MSIDITKKENTSLFLNLGYKNEMINPENDFIIRDNICSCSTYQNNVDKNELIILYKNMIESLKTEIKTLEEE